MVKGCAGAVGPERVQSKLDWKFKVKGRVTAKARPFRGRLSGSLDFPYAVLPSRPCDKIKKTKAKQVLHFLWAWLFGFFLAFPIF